jgi:hypothetical protein
MGSGPPLLCRIHRLIEASYDWATGIADLSEYLVGDEGYRRLYGQRVLVEEVGAPLPPARTLVRWEGGETRACIYLPDSLVSHLEARNPLRSLDDRNVEAFSTLVEELDHLLMLAWCSRHGRPVRLLELEFHANVTKYLVLAHFLGRLTGRSRLSTGQRSWLRDRLFSRSGEGLAPPLASRYRVAARLACRFLGRLEPVASEERVRILRRFVRQDWSRQRRILEGGELRGASGPGLTG